MGNYLVMLVAAGVGAAIVVQVLREMTSSLTTRPPGPGDWDD